MKVFVAGATGVMGRQLVPRLVAAGHKVVGMTRTESKRATLSELGATPVVADGLEADQVATAVAEAQPDVIVHQLTAISSLDLRHFDRDFALTNRLRTDGTDHLLSAAHAVGVRRFIAQSYTSWPYARTGGPVKSEEDPLDPTPAREMRESLAAIRHLETAVTGADWTDGIVLRYGAFYGPGTSMSSDGEQFEMIRKRKFPVVGRRRRRVVVHAHRGRRRSDGGGGRAWRARDLQRRRRRPGAGRRMVASAGADAGRAEAVAGAAVRWPAVRRRGRRGDDDRLAGRVERQGETRVRLEASPPELAGGVRRVSRWRI